MPLPFKTRYEISESQLVQYEGTYTFRSSKQNTDVVVQAKDGFLTIEFSGVDSDAVDAVTSRAVSKDLFMSLHRGSVIYFARGENGEVNSLLSGGDKYWKA